MPELWQKENLVRTEFVHRSIDRLGTGREINRRGTPSTVSNEFLYKTSPLRTLCVPSEVNLVSEGVRFDPWPHDFFLFLYFFSFSFFPWDLRSSLQDMLDMFRVKRTCENVWRLSSFVQIDNKSKLSDTLNYGVQSPPKFKSCFKYSSLIFNIRGLSQHLFKFLIWSSRLTVLVMQAHVASVSR